MKSAVKPVIAPRPLSTGLGYLITATYRSFSKLLAAELAQRGIPFKQYFYLRALLEEDGMSQIALGERVGMTRATVTGVVDTMERQGLVRRVPDPEDRRIYRIRLTAKGRGLRGAVLKTIEAIQLEASAGISERELAQFRQTAEKLQRNVVKATKQRKETLVEAERRAIDRVVATVPAR